MSPSDRLRCFIALDLDTPVRQRIEELTNELSGADANVRWTPAANLHLTLKFLGNVAAARLAHIEQACRRAATEHTSFSFAVRGIGVFPQPSMPRVLWAGIEGEEVRLLAQSIERHLEPLGFKPEKRPFRPHLTLGRLRSPRGWTELEPLVRVSEDKVFGTCKAQTANAYRSDLRPDGAVYTKLWAAELQPPSSRSTGMDVSRK